MKNRVHGERLLNTEATADVSKMSLTTWLPSVDDCILLRKEFITLVARVFVSKLKAFEDFYDVVEAHIPHQYSKAMSEKSHIVSELISSFIIYTMKLS